MHGVLVHRFDNNLLKKETWKDAGGTIVNTITRTYNARGQWLTVTDNAGTITREYDELGRLKKQIDVNGLTLNFAYDKLDRLLSITDSLGGVQENVYDDASRVLTRKYHDSTSALRADYVYSDTNMVTDTKRFDDLAGTLLRSETIAAYDAADKVLSLTQKDGSGTVIDSFNYQYDVTGKVLQETSTVDPTKNYTYDLTDQLTGDGTSTWGYGQNGNRNTAGYTTGTGNLYSTANGYTLTYDDAGNIATKSKSGEYWTFAYDHNNHLIDAKKYDASGGALQLEVKFAYDALGNRIEKDVDSTGSGTFTVTPRCLCWDRCGQGGRLLRRRRLGA